MPGNPNYPLFFANSLKICTIMAARAGIKELLGLEDMLKKSKAL